MFNLQKIFYRKKIFGKGHESLWFHDWNLNKFENQNIQTFVDNKKFMGDVPFSIYFDFETTAGNKISKRMQAYILSLPRVLQPFAPH